MLTGEAFGIIAAAAHSARQARQDLAAGGREIARIVDGRMGPGRPPAQSRRAQPTAVIDYVA